VIHWQLEGDCEEASVLKGKNRPRLPSQQNDKRRKKAKNTSLKRGLGWPSDGSNGGLPRNIAQTQKRGAISISMIYTTGAIWPGSRTTALIYQDMNT
jgi:hypothetical protein